MNSAEDRRFALWAVTLGISASACGRDAAPAVVPVEAKEVAAWASASASSSSPVADASSADGDAGTPTATASSSAAPSASAPPVPPTPGALLAHLQGRAIAHPKLPGPPPTSPATSLTPEERDRLRDLNANCGVSLYPGGHKITTKPRLVHYVDVGLAPKLALDASVASNARVAIAVVGNIARGCADAARGSGSLSAPRDAPNDAGGILTIELRTAGGGDGIHATATSREIAIVVRTCVVNGIEKTAAFAKDGGAATLVFSVAVGSRWEFDSAMGPPPPSR